MKTHLWLFFILIALTNLPTWADDPLFIPIGKCPSSAKELIAELKIDSRKIHSCAAKIEDLFASPKKVEIVDLVYGDPDDCIAGCIYRNFSAAIELLSGRKRFWQVPQKLSILNLRDFPEYAAKSNRKDFSCEYKDNQDFARRTYGKQDGNWGLYLELKKPLVCTWIETVSTSYPHNYTRSLNKGFKIRGEWTGFIFLKSALRKGERRRYGLKD
ncbi:MAG: hypothetical protein IPK04_16375 [Bdellovibrionales bacterium]|nr:hypothetical protein [Bdellovibrionales bacterium]